MVPYERQSRIFVVNATLLGMLQDYLEPHLPSYVAFYYFGSFGFRCFAFFSVSFPRLNRIAFATFAFACFRNSACTTRTFTGFNCTTDLEQISEHLLCCLTVYQQRQQRRQ